jgi:hypothetical protein
MLGSLEQTRNLLLQQQIEVSRQLREIGKLTPKKSNNDYIIIRQGRKKEGFVYCVKYYVFGKLLPTKYSLKTTDLETAQKRAIAWKEKLLNSYKKGANMASAFHNLLAGYYADSPY